MEPLHDPNYWYVITPDAGYVRKSEYFPAQPPSFGMNYFVVLRGVYKQFGKITALRYAVKRWTASLIKTTGEWN